MLCYSFILVSLWNLLCNIFYCCCRVHIFFTENSTGDRKNTKSFFFMGISSNVTHIFEIFPLFGKSFSWKVKEFSVKNFHSGSFWLFCSKNFEIFNFLLELVDFHSWMVATFLSLFLTMGHFVALVAKIIFFLFSQI